jgi:hypothetical protein
MVVVMDTDDHPEFAISIGGHSMMGLHARASGILRATVASVGATKRGGDQVF